MIPVAVEEVIRRLETWVEHMHYYTDEQYGKGNIKQLIEDLRGGETNMDLIHHIKGDEPLFERFSEEFRALCLDPQPIKLLLSKLQAWALFSELQLALRHPDNKGSAAEIARHFAAQLQKKVATTPALAEVAKRGWDPKYDT
jgi:hypothetical protein